MTLDGGRWGFCARCGRWLCSEAWFRADPSGPRCPACGDEPHPIEILEEGRGRLVVQLDLPPGTDLPALS
ncbi:MAG: hypothetical protein ACRDYD_14175 [Acidimicrobiales bacterium]